MDKFYDLEEIAPIAMIREHTKTDDVPQVTDDQIRLYRAASFEAANKYTGNFWDRLITLTEPVKEPRRKHRFVRNVVIQTKYPVVDGFVQMHGVYGNFPIRIVPGTRKIELPISQDLVLMENCCNPCRQSTNQNYVTYLTGTKDVRDIPSGVILGVLKYVAWSMKNPGDEIMTVRNRLGISDSGELIGTNSGAWASGAIEVWNLYRVPRKQ